MSKQTIKQKAEHENNSVINITDTINKGIPTIVVVNII